ncbi:MAG: hypothetical protein NW202_11255 [Nitrospira sp.]|nr:hypothetical protein [Nitrospira sp.]
MGYGKSKPVGTRGRKLMPSGIMKTVVLDVRSPNEAMADFVRAWKTGKGEKAARITFATPELLWKVLTAKRWQLLKAMCGAGPLSIRETARRIGRDVKAVNTDVTALLNAGVLDRVEDGRVIFPFDSVKVEFLLHAA